MGPFGDSSWHAQPILPKFGGVFCLCTISPQKGPKVSFDSLCQKVVLGVQTTFQVSKLFGLLICINTSCQVVCNNKKNDIGILSVLADKKIIFISISRYENKLIGRLLWYYCTLKLSHTYICNYHICMNELHIKGYNYSLYAKYVSYNVPNCTQYYICP